MNYEFAVHFVSLKMIFVSLEINLPSLLLGCNLWSTQKSILINPLLNYL